MERMEAQLASLTVMVQHAVVPRGSRPNSAYSSSEFRILLPFELTPKYGVRGRLL